MEEWEMATAVAHSLAAVAMHCQEDNAYLETVITPIWLPVHNNAVPGIMGVTVAVEGTVVQVVG